MAETSQEKQSRTDDPTEILQVQILKNYTGENITDEIKLRKTEWGTKSETIKIKWEAILNADMWCHSNKGDS